MREKLMEVLKGNCPDVDFMTEADFVDEGLLDSLSIVRIVSAISTDFGITIPYDEISAENFNSIDAMIALIERCKKV